MARWSKAVEGSIFHTEKSKMDGTFIKKYYESKAFQPKNDEEKKELEDFSFIVSVMYLLVHLAKADGTIDPEERKQIIDELVIQLEQRHFEYDILAKEFGNSDKEIIMNIFTKIDLEHDTNEMDETLTIIKKIYQFNPYKLRYILRVCLLVAYVDDVMTIQEKKIVQSIAQKFDISGSEFERIEEEVIRSRKR